MSKPIIVLVSTFESDLKHEIYEEFNSFETKSKIVEFFNYDEGIAKNVLDELKQNKEKYPHNSVELVESGEYSTFIKNVIDGGNFISVMDDLFVSVYGKIFENIKDTTFDEPALIDITHLGTKPSFCTHFVGWITNNDTSSIEHLAEHENIAGDYALQLINIHNTWLRNNKNKFDLFFDGTSKEEVLEQLKKL